MVYSDVKTNSRKQYEDYLDSPPSRVINNGELCPSMSR